MSEKVSPQFYATPGVRVPIKGSIGSAYVDDDGTVTLTQVCEDEIMTAVFCCYAAFEEYDGLQVYILDNYHLYDQMIVEWETAKESSFGEGKILAAKCLKFAKKVEKIEKEFGEDYVPLNVRKMAARVKNFAYKIMNIKPSVPVSFFVKKTD
jgi:hypothetical protein